MAGSRAGWNGSAGQDQAAQLVDGYLGRDAPGDQQVDDLGDRLLVLLIERDGLYQVCQTFAHHRQVLVNRAVQRWQRGNGISKAHTARVVTAGQMHVVDVISVSFQRGVVDDQESATLVKRPALPAMEWLADLHRLWVLIAFELMCVLASYPPLKKSAASYNFVFADRCIFAAKRLFYFFGFGLQEVGKPTCCATPTELMGVLDYPNHGHGKFLHHRWGRAAMARGLVARHYEGTPLRL